MKTSLGALLALGLAGLQFIAVLIVVFSSYVSSERALLDHARDLLRDVGNNTIEHSKSFLMPAHGAAVLAARLAQNDVVASDDPALLEQLLFQQLQIATQFSGLYYGARDGSFVYVMRAKGPAPFRTKIITFRDGQRHTELIWRDDSYNVVLRESDPSDPYDPRTRPWYIRASAERATIWTDPYIFFSSQQPGITLAAPVLDAWGGVRGVMGVDIEISNISEFLSHLKIGETGKALIIHDNGDVIAHPTPSLIKTENDDGTLRFVKIGEFGDPIARAAFGPLFASGKVAAITKPVMGSLTYDKRTYVAVVMPKINDQLPWTIAVYAPEDDFTNVIRQNRTTNIWIAAAVAAITALIGLGLADYIHRPVRDFAARSAQLSQGALDPAEPAPKTYKELEKANSALLQQISERRKTEWEYGQTFDKSVRGMAQIEPVTCRFLRVNARFCAITGYSAQELSAMRFLDLLPPAERAALAPDGHARQEEFPEIEDLPCIRKDGVTIRVRLNMIVVRGQDGVPEHGVITMDDVTQARAQQMQIDRLNRDLSHLARGNTMGQMASGLAHELNQPLTAIAQNADTARMILDATPVDTAELQQILDEIESQSLRAGDIIRALRSFIRKDDAGRSALDLGPLAEQTCRLIQAEASEARVTVRQTIGRLPPVHANRVHVAQVLVNLMRNAIEAIAAAPGAERRITLSARRMGPTVEVSVSDTGPGVPANLDLFAQFETTKRDGMGLGLSICRSIVEANGGRLWHEALPGGGARFSFTLPVAEPAGSGPEGAEAIPPRPAPSTEDVA